MITRKKEFNASAEPSANAISALNLLKLRDITGELSYEEKAKGIFKSVTGEIGRYSSAFCSTLVALDYFFSESKQIVISDPQHFSAETENLLKELRSNFHPNVLLLNFQNNSILKTVSVKQNEKQDLAFYICSKGVCLEPKNRVGEVLTSL